MFVAYKYIRQKTSKSGETSSQKKPEKPLCSHLARQSQIEHTPTRDTSDEVPLRELGSGSAQGRYASHSSTRGDRDRKCRQCEEQRRRERIYSWKLIGGLCLPFTLATLDLTIVATAVPSIASHFHKFDELTWVVTAFTLTSTTFIPVFGQLADVFGRHAVLQLALFLMLIGSVLCAAAQTWGMLLLGRALQGASSAGLMNIIMIILADKVSLRVTAKNNSLFTMVGGVGYAIGPVIGGYLTDDNWRYCFVIPIPIAFISHILIYILLRKELVEGTIFRRRSGISAILPGLATVDIFGCILFMFGIGLTILATAWGGATYAWSAPQVLGPLVVGGICFVLFFVYEYFLESGRVIARLFPKQVPMLPYSMFTRKDTIWLTVMEVSIGASMYSVFYFIGIYFTLIEAYPASKAGIELLYYIPGLGAGVYLAMLLCNVFPAQTFHPLNAGTILTTLGLALVIYAIHTQNTPLLNGMMVLTGAGTGLRFMPSNLHAVGVWPERIAPALSLMRFAMPFGGTISLTIMGSVFNNKFQAAVGSHNHSGSVAESGRGSGNLNMQDTSSSLSFIDGLASDEQVVVRNMGGDAIMWAYIAIMPIMGVSLLVGLVMGNVWIKPDDGKSDISRDRRVEEEQVGVEVAQEEMRHSEVIYVPFLWALVKGNVNSYKHVSRPVSETEKQAGR
ncbi:putative MFS multidrug transporter [Aspergillus affinis]|uniref:putative MFS multidrug transporter n=1 Tax=Aspergillus affinis TaxID=1070780 RepID=UPI0022FDF817|nr:MFS general substrate transporter [Aspergillus affinis]KAI9040046.1 MFS general substrate transporter [Aspergillus affinis]